MGWSRDSEYPEEEVSHVTSVYRSLGTGSVLPVAIMCRVERRAGDCRPRNNVVKRKYGHKLGSVCPEQCYERPRGVGAHVVNVTRYGFAARGRIGRSSASRLQMS
jgi:hypothetical protein